MKMLILIARVVFVVLSWAFLISMGFNFESMQQSFCKEDKNMYINNMQLFNYVISGKSRKSREVNFDFLNYRYVQCLPQHSNKSLRN